MQFKIFAIACSGDDEVEARLNLFLKRRRIVHVERQVVNIENQTCWSFCVEYLDDGDALPTNFSNGKKHSAARVDYRELLSDEDFTIFAKLRKWRKDTAFHEGIPLYTIFTNEQLAKIAETRPQTKGELLKIPGFGEGKLNRYGEAILNLTQNQKDKPTEGTENCDASED